MFKKHWSTLKSTSKFYNHTSGLKSKTRRSNSTYCKNYLLKLYCEKLSQKIAYTLHNINFRFGSNHLVDVFSNPEWSSYGTQVSFVYSWSVDTVRSWSGCLEYYHDRFFRLFNWQLQVSLFSCSCLIDLFGCTSASSASLDWFYNAFVDFNRFLSNKVTLLWFNHAFVDFIRKSHVKLLRPKIFVTWGSCKIRLLTVLQTVTCLY